MDTLLKTSYKEFSNEKCFTTTFCSAGGRHEKPAYSLCTMTSSSSFFFVKYQKQKNHNVIFLFRPRHPRTAMNVKWTNKNTRHFKQFACLLCWLPSQKRRMEKRWNIYENLCTFLWRSRASMCTVCNVLLFSFEGTRRNDLLGFMPGWWRRAPLMDTNPPDEWWHLLDFILISLHEHFLSAPGFLTVDIYDTWSI